MGAPALFGAVEQAWLAGTVRQGQLGRAFARNAAIGFIGNAVGAVVAGLPQLARRWLPGSLTYRPLFAFALLTALVSLVLLSGTEDATGRNRRDLEQDGEERDGAQRAVENRLLLGLAGVNALNGLGIGLAGPLLVWWFAARYGAGPAAIGPANGLTLQLCSVSSLLAGRLAARRGMLRVIVGMRAVGLILLVLLPFMPTFPLAVIIYAARMVLNRGTAGQRHALILGTVRGHRRGLAASVSGLSTQLPRALGPFVAGACFRAGLLTVPFLLAAGFQATYLVLYRRLFAGPDLR